MHVQLSTYPDSEMDLPLPSVWLLPAVLARPLDSVLARPRGKVSCSGGDSIQMYSRRNYAKASKLPRNHARFSEIMEITRKKGV